MVGVINVATITDVVVEFVTVCLRWDVDVAGQIIFEGDWGLIIPKLVWIVAYFWRNFVMCLDIPVRGNAGGNGSTA